MSILRFLLRGLKIARRGAWAAFTTRYTRLYLRTGGVRLGKGCRSNGIPELELSMSGHFTAGVGLQLQNGRHYNMIGRQQRCYFIVGKDATLTIGNHVGISGTAIVCHESVSIGDHTCIGMNCVIYDTDFHDLDYRKRAMIPEDFSNVHKKPVRIGRHVFIGGHSTILKGVTIGDGAIVGAGAVVTKDIPAGEIWGGNPARFLSRARTGAVVTDNIRSIAVANETR
ncbi:MAG TPA: acyltransferase [Puia sp.]|nr:acyltransferase [Puia sp.]